MLLAAVFILQVVLAAVAVAVAGPIARRSHRAAVILSVSALGLLLLWPLVRLSPALPIHLLGAPVVACLELTGLFIPAALVLATAARLVPRRRDRRAIYLLLPIAAVYFVRAGWWMVSPPMHDLGPTRFEAGVCRQSTGYTCVAASLVTMLRAHGIDSSETEMARLAHVEVNGGATDSRALWALERKLAGTTLRADYATLDIPGLIAAPKPLLVQLDWGFFVSHMVPVLQATSTAITIGDPISGRQVLPVDEFARKWKGNAITLARRDPGKRDSTRPSGQ